MYSYPNITTCYWATARKNGLEFPLKQQSNAMYHVCPIAFTWAANLEQQQSQLTLKSVVLWTMGGKRVPVVKSNFVWTECLKCLFLFTENILHEGPVSVWAEWITETQCEIVNKTEREQQPSVSRDYVQWFLKYYSLCLLYQTSCINPFFFFFFSFFFFFTGDHRYGRWQPAFEVQENDRAKRQKHAACKTNTAKRAAIGW